METTAGWSKPFASVRESWSTVYRIAAVGALAMVAFIPIQIFVFITWPPPKDPVAWFALFDYSKLVGLIDLDLFMMIDEALVAVMLIALYRALKDSNRPLMTLALVLGLLGISSYYASAVAIDMLNLSNKYDLAVTPEERASLIAAGESMLATWQGSAYDVGYVLLAVAILLTSIVMARGYVFGKVTAWVGIVLGVLSLVPANVPVIGMWFALGSLIPLVIWDVLIARKLLLLS